MFHSVTHALDKRKRHAEQGKLEGSALYAQQQAANAAAAATCIQAVWRGRQARRSTASMQVVLQQQQQLDRAATAIQVSHAVQVSHAIQVSHAGDKSCPVLHKGAANMTCHSVCAVIGLDAAWQALRRNNDSAH